VVTYNLGFSGNHGVVTYNLASDELVSKYSKSENNKPYFILFLEKEAYSFSLLINVCIQCGILR